MRQNRHPQQLRDISVTTGYSRHAEGSAFVTWGHNKLIATVSIDNRLPQHLRQNKRYRGGWLHAEYAMLPRSTPDRHQRERLYDSGRTQEIQRLIGRVLRSAVDLSLFPGKTLTVDIDIIEADGGTRCAGILGAYAALHHAAERLIYDGTLSEWPLRYELAAVSVGIVNDQQLIDLEYSEDVEADADLNVVATAEGRIIEVQGGTEGAPIEAETYVQLVASGIEAARRVITGVRGSLSQKTGSQQTGSQQTGS